MAWGLGPGAGGKEYIFKNVCKIEKRFPPSIKIEKYVLITGCCSIYMPLLYEDHKIYTFYLLLFDFLLLRAFYQKEGK